MGSKLRITTGFFMDKCYILEYGYEKSHKYKFIFSEISIFQELIKFF